MTAKRIFLLFLILVIMAAGCSCGTQNNKASGPLTITMMDYDVHLSSVVESFNNADHHLHHGGPGCINSSQG